MLARFWSGRRKRLYSPARTWRSCCRNNDSNPCWLPEFWLFRFRCEWQFVGVPASAGKRKPPKGGTPTMAVCTQKRKSPDFRWRNARGSLGGKGGPWGQSSNSDREKAPRSTRRGARPELSGQAGIFDRMDCIRRTGSDVNLDGLLLTGRYVSPRPHTGTCQNLACVACVAEAAWYNRCSRRSDKSGSKKSV